MDKRITTFLLINALFVMLFSCNPEKVKKNASVGAITATDDVIYDSVAAKKYGADDYGMKKYVMAFLKRGPNRELDSAKAAELQMAHLKNIDRMAEEGKLVLAGPFFGKGDLRGIYIFNVSSIEEAEQLTNSDPAIQAGSLEMELMEWYGSAALMEVNDLHKTLSKKNDEF